MPHGFSLGDVFAVVLFFLFFLVVSAVKAAWERLGFVVLGIVFVAGCAFMPIGASSPRAQREQIGGLAGYFVNVRQPVDEPVNHESDPSTAVASVNQAPDIAPAPVALPGSASTPEHRRIRLPSPARPGAKPRTLRGGVTASAPLVWATVVPEPPPSPESTAGTISQDAAIVAAEAIPEATVVPAPTAAPDTEDAMAILAMILSSIALLVAGVALANANAALKKASVVVGPTGRPGEHGPAGERGATGATGSSGQRGLTGDAGERGRTGKTGPAGEPGEDAEPALRGLRGRRGEAGGRGLRGYAGKVIAAVLSRSKKGRR